MAKRKSILSRVKLVYRHSPLLLKCAVLATIVLSTAALTTLRLGIDQYQEQTAQVRAQAAQLEQENQKLDNQLQQKDTVEGVKSIATEQLGLVDPGCIMFQVEENQE